MILITKIEVKKVSGNIHDVMHSFDPFSESIKKEIIEGRIFINQNNEEVVIRMSSKNQKLIGLPFEAFDTLRKENEKLTKEINNLVQKNQRLVYEVMHLDQCIEYIRNWSFWRRFKFLIKGTNL